MFKPLSILSVIFLVGVVRGQDSPGPINTLNFDTSKFKVAVRMDRAVYLPGEVAQITFEVSNPGAATIGLIPFTALTGCTYLGWKVGDDFQEERDPACIAYAVDSTTTTTFGAGERRQKIFNSYDNSFERGYPMISGGGVWFKAGIYRLTYRYGTSIATADFTVVAPKLEANAVARLKDALFKEHSAQEQPQVLKEYVHVLALRVDDVTYICVAQAPVVQDTDLFRNADGTFNPGGASPLKRIAESTVPVVSISAKAERDENLVIEWTDATGGQRILDYREGYPAAWRSRAVRQ